MKRERRQTVVSPVFNALDGVGMALNSVGRLAEFWGRAGVIYTGFKTTQLENSLLMRDREQRDRRWEEHHAWAAMQMYAMCVDMRGFFLKAGQFLGMRDDFFPKPYIEHLSKLQDRVPPMTARETRRSIERELGGKPVESVFSDLRLDEPLGSGTIAQVHAAVRIADSRNVAVKIQYPNAEDRMIKDLRRLRALSQFLQRTELKFDLVSAVDELAAELRKEFDFRGEANAMTRIFANLRRRRVNRVEIPKPDLDLSTSRMLVMTFVDGIPMSQLEGKLSGLSPKRRKFVCQRLLEQVADVYGGMILLDGLFQADPHPGNILLKKDMSIGIVDFGQWKSLNKGDRHSLARLIQQMNRRDPQGTKNAMEAMGVRFKRITEPHPGQMLPEEKLAHTMFDTRKVDGVTNDPFDENSAIKETSVEAFPKQLFFVLRTVQIIRGVAHGMNLPAFSLCKRWNGDAEKVLRSHG